MTDLNSVLIEGTIKDGPKLGYVDGGNAVCVLTIENAKRIRQDDCSTGLALRRFRVKAHDRLAEQTAERMENAMHCYVRVVGFLDADEDGAFIAAEAIFERGRNLTITRSES